MICPVETSQRRISHRCSGVFWLGDVCRRHGVWARDGKLRLSLCVIGGPDRRSIRRRNGVFGRALVGLDSAGVYAPFLLLALTQLLVLTQL